MSALGERAGPAWRVSPGDQLRPFLGDRPDAAFAVAVRQGIAPPVSGQPVITSGPSRARCRWRNASPGNARELAVISRVFGARCAGAMSLRAERGNRLARSSRARIPGPVGLPPPGCVGPWLRWRGCTRAADRARWSPEPVGRGPGPRRRAARGWRRPAGTSWDPGKYLQ